MAGYAIIKLGGKQYVVREGEKLLVDRLDVDENKTFNPDVIFEGGDGKAEPAEGPVRDPEGARARPGREDPHRQVPSPDGLSPAHGHRSKLTQVQVESIGTKRHRLSGRRRYKVLGDRTTKPEKKTRKWHKRTWLFTHGRDCTRSGSA